MLCPIENKDALSADHPLQDIFRVGPSKPLGYLPVPAIKNANCNPTKLKVWVAKQHLKSLLLSGSTLWLHDETVIESKGQDCDIFHVYDEESLYEFLFRYKFVLRPVGIPITPREYVEHIHSHVYNWHPFAKVNVVIGKSFADPRFNEIEVIW